MSLNFAVLIKCRNFATSNLILMFSRKKSDALLEMIRNKQPMTGGQKMSLIVLLSVPGILAQMTSVLMFYIDAAMVGHLGANESASIGLVESSTWLFGTWRRGTARTRPRSWQARPASAGRRSVR